MRAHGFRSAPESFSRAVRAFPQTHAAVRRQSMRASESMVIGERPPLQLPIVRSHPGDATKARKQPAARRSRGPQGAKPVPPGPPEICLPLQVTAPDEIVLRWTAPANELEAPVECYCVEMRRVPDLDATGPAAVQKPFQAVATRMGNARRAAVRRLQQGVTYEFRARACSGGGWGVYSAIEAVPLPLGDTLALEVVPEQLLDDQIQVTWHYPAGSPPSDTVHLQWRPPNDLAWRNEYIREQQLTYVLDGLSPCTDYTLRARMGDEGTWCLPFRIQTKPRRPAAPIFTRSDVYSRSVSLEFTCTDPGGQTAKLEYEVEVAQGREESEPDEELTGLDGVKVQGTTYVAKGLLPFSTYFARVRCSNSRGLSEWSEALRLQTTDSEAVPGACIVTAVPMPGQGRYASSSGGIFVEWEAPAPLPGLELTKYDLEWLPAQADVHSEWRGRLLPATTHEFEIEDLRPGAEYYVRVCGTNRNGPGEWGVTSSLSGLCVAPAPTLNLHKAAHDSISVSWECLTEQDGAEDVFSFQLRCFEEAEAGEWKPLKLPKMTAEQLAAGLPAEATSDSGSSAPPSTTDSDESKEEDEDDPEEEPEQEPEPDAEGAPVVGEVSNAEAALSEEALLLKQKAMQNAESLDEGGDNPFMGEVPAHFRDYSVGKLKSEHAYMFQICSLTARGSSGWSHPFCFVTHAVIQLDMANVATNSAAVNVQMASATGTADLRCENQFIPTEKLAASCLAGETAEFTDLTAGCTYHVFGRPAGSDSQWTGPLQFSTRAGLPKAPSLSAFGQATEDSLRVEWEPVFDGGEALRDIEIQWVQGDTEALLTANDAAEAAVAAAAAAAAAAAEVSSQALDVADDVQREALDAVNVQAGHLPAGWPTHYPGPSAVELMDSVDFMPGGWTMHYPEPEAEPEPEPKLDSESAVEPEPLPKLHVEKLAWTSDVFTLAQLESGSQYSCRIRAANMLGLSEWSKPMLATTLETSIPKSKARVATLPPKLVLKQKSVGVGEIDVQWQPGKHKGEVSLHYRISLAALRNRRKPGSVGSRRPATAWTVISLGAGSKSHSLDKLAPGAEYEFRLCASNEAGQTYSNVLKARSLIDSPAAPAGLTVLPTDPHTVRVSWNPAVTGDGVTKYMITLQQLTGGTDEHVHGPELAVPPDPEPEGDQVTPTFEWVPGGWDMHYPSETTPEPDTETEPEPEPEPEPEFTPGPEKIIEILCPESSYNLTELEPNCKYSVQLVCVNDAGTSEPAETEVVTLTGRPDELNVSLTSATHNSLTLGWQALDSSAGVPLEWIDIEWEVAGVSNGRLRSKRRTKVHANRDNAAVQKGHSKEIAHPVSGSMRISSRRTGLRLMPLDIGAEYRIKARAICKGDLAGVWSATSKFATLKARPGPVTLFVEDVSSNSLSIWWKQPDNHGARIEYYEVRVTNTVNREQQFVTQVDYHESHQQHGLQPGAAYRVTVRAVNAIGTSDWSTPTVVCTNESTEVPGSITWRNLGGIEDAVPALIPADVAWDPPPTEKRGPELLGYEMETLVYPHHTTFDEHARHTQMTNLPVCRTARLPVLQPGECCRYRIRALNAHGQGCWSPIRIAAAQAHVPSPPCVASVETQARSMELHWTVPDGDGGAHITSFDVVVDSTHNQLYEAFGTSTVIDYLEPSSSYSVQVRAWNNCGASDWSIPSIQFTKPLPELEKVHSCLQQTPPDLGTIFSLLSTMGDESIQNLRDSYQQEYHTDIAADVASVATGGMAALIDTLLGQPHRSASKASPSEDAVIIRAGTRDRGQGAHARPIAEVVINRSPDQVELLCSQYVLDYGRTVHEDLRLLVDGEFREAVLQLVPPQSLFPIQFTDQLDLLNDMLEGEMSTSDWEKLVDFVIEKSDAQLNDLQDKFRRRFGCDLTRWVCSKCSGGAKLVLESLLNGEHNNGAADFTMYSEHSAEENAVLMFEATKGRPDGSIDYQTVMNLIVRSSETHAVAMCDVYSGMYGRSVREDLVDLAFVGDHRQPFLYAVCVCVPDDQTLSPIPCAETADSLHSSLTDIDRDDNRQQVVRMLTGLGSSEEAAALSECFKKRHGEDLVSWIKDPKALQLHKSLQQMIVAILTSAERSMDISTALAGDDMAAIRDAATNTGPARQKFVETLSFLLSSRSRDHLEFMFKNYTRMYARTPHEEIAKIAEQSDKKTKEFYASAVLGLPPAEDFIPLVNPRAIALYTALSEKVCSAENEQAVVSVLLKCSNGECTVLQSTFEARYDDQVSRLVDTKVKTGVKEIIMQLLLARRDESSTIDKELAANEAASLRDAIVAGSTSKKLDYAGIAKVLFARNEAQLLRICRHYLIRFGRTVAEDLVHHMNPSADDSFLVACRQSLPDEQRIWDVLPLTHRSTLEHIANGLQDDAIRVVMSLRNGHRLDEVMVLIEKRFGYSLLDWAKMNSPGEADNAEGGLVELMRAVIEAENDRWWMEPHVYMRMKPAEDAELFRKALAKQNPDMLYLAGTAAPSGAPPPLHDFIRVLERKEVAHLQKVCGIYFETNNRTLHEDVRRSPFSTIETEDDRRVFRHAVLAMLPNESAVRALPYTEEARAIYTALVEGDSVDVTTVTKIVAFMPQQSINLLAATYNKRSPLQARSLFNDVKRTVGPSRHLLLRLIHEPGRSTAVRVDVAKARRAAAMVNRALCSTERDGSRYMVPAYDKVSDLLAEVSPPQAIAICDAYLECFNRPLQEAIHRCCTTDLASVWSQAACLCLSLPPPDMLPPPHEDPLPWASKVHALETALRSLSARQEDPSCATSGQMVQPGTLFSELAGLSNVQLQELIAAYSHRTLGKSLLQEIMAVTGGPYQILLMEILKCRQDAVAKVSAREVGNGAARAAAVKAEKLSKAVQQLRRVLTSTEASLSEAERASHCVEFFVNRNIDIIRAAEGDYALRFEHTLEHDLNSAFHGLFLECILVLLER